MDTLLTPGQYAGLITDHLFIKTPLGIAAFAAGFLLSLWHSFRSANFSRFFIFASIAIAVSSLIIEPRRQADRAPVLFAFISDAADAVFKAVIPLEKPFAPHRLSFQMRAFIRQGVQDPALKDRLAAFVHDHYLTALGMANLRAWPGDPRVVNNYSPQARTEWEGLKQALLKVLNSSASPWSAVRDILSQYSGISPNDLDGQALQSLIQRGISAPHPHLDLAWRACSAILAVFPNIAGFADALLGVIFPFILLALLVTYNLSFLASYFRNFIWIKSWVLGAALCHYASMSMAYAQAKSPSAFWFWMHPYYAAFGAVLLCLMPLMTFLLINSPPLAGGVRGGGRS